MPWLAFAVVAVAWFWSMRTPQAATPQLAVVFGGTAMATALIAAIRNMSLPDVLELLWDLIAGLLSFVGAIVAAIWSTILDWLGLN